MVIPVERSSAMLGVFATMLVGICHSKCAGQYRLSLYLGGAGSSKPFLDEGGFHRHLMGQTHVSYVQLEFTVRSAYTKDTYQELAFRG